MAHRAAAAPNRRRIIDHGRTPVASRMSPGQSPDTPGHRVTECVPEPIMPHWRWRRGGELLLMPVDPGENIVEVGWVNFHWKGRAVQGSVKVPGWPVRVV
jgi:hypothetical protein